MNSRTLTTVSYGRRIDMLASESPEACALVFIARDRTRTELTWRELSQRTNQIARLLARRGLSARQMAVVSLPNCLDHILVAIAAWKLGATPVPMRHDLPDQERNELLRLASPALIVEEQPAGSLEGLARAALAEAVRLPDAPLEDQVAVPRFAICSGGSTGRPKLIVDSRPATVDLESFGDPFLAEMGWVAGRTHLIAGPLYHANGFSLAHLALLLGQRVVLLERFDAGLAAEVIERERINCGTLVPTMLFRLARLPGIERLDWSSIVSIYHGGAACAPWLKRRWIELIGAERLYEGFGSTEAVGETLIRGDEWLEHPGSVGRGTHCDIRILAPERREAAPGTVGEIFMRWKGEARSTYRYIGQASAEVTPDGFASVGDLGWLDAEGYLYVADRRTDMIISGGANIYPAEVEAALLEHAAVADVAVIGLPDEEWGKRVHALVVPAVPARAPTVAELDAHCRLRIARYKVPKSYEFLSTLPRNEVGKIRKVDLIQERTGRTTSGVQETAGRPMGYQTIEVTTEEHVATIALRRPEQCNAINPLMARELAHALRTLKVRALVLTGDERAFCAGADLSEIEAVFANPSDEQLVPELAALLEDYPAPTIAAIEGHCLGGGFELAIRCDLRIASSTARLGTPEVRHGYIAGGIIERTARLIGVARTKELMFFGHPLDAGTALRWGLVSEVTEPAHALAAARKQALDLARGAPLALAEIKRLLRETQAMSREDAYRTEMSATQRISQTADASEGVAAFLEKRAPHFRGE